MADSLKEMDKELKAIERIKMASKMSLHHYGKPLVCTYSGGKDSDVMLELFKRSGIPFEVHNSHTTADAPQTVRHIKKNLQSWSNKESLVRLKSQHTKENEQVCGN